MSTTETDTRFSTIALSMLGGVALFIITAFLSSDAKPKHNALTPETMADYVINEMPDSVLRRNLLIVFGAEYGEDSQELNDLLSMFSQMKIDQLQKQRSKDSL
jgi:hypothetical protein